MLFRLDLFGRGQLRLVELDEGRGERARIMRGQQCVDHRHIFFRRRFGQQRVLQQAFGIEPADFFGRRRIAPGEGDAGTAQHFFGASAARRRHQQDADALLAGAAGTAAAVLQHLRVVGQLGMDH